jgi:hypothetical protein
MAKQKVMLVKQSYREARESNLVGELGLLGLITASSSDGAFTGNSLYELDKSLREEAEKMGATHVFGIEYQGEGVHGRPEYPSVGFTMVSGDAYKTPKTSKQ